MSSWTAAALPLSLLLAISARPADRVDLRPDFSEAVAVLSILDKRAQHQAVKDSDWQRLFATVPYQRLKQRESSMRRPFSDEAFKTFVSSLDDRRTKLGETLTAWRKADLAMAATRPLTYLPAEATIHASVYPVVKPQTNNFVFEASTNPAIFLYIDPKISRAQFENTVAHELHHIGLASLEERYEERVQALPENNRKAALWMGAFGEGMAVLASAGSPDVPPLAAYTTRDQIAWEVDYDRVDSDLDALDQFFLDVVHGAIRGDAVGHVGSTFFGYRGPWYTVGYLMATTIEKQLGRAALIETLKDPRQFVFTYNQAASKHNESLGPKLPLFSAEGLDSVGVKPEAASLH
jgi:hypothetical protein